MILGVHQLVSRTIQSLFTAFCRRRRNNMNLTRYPGELFTSRRKLYTSCVIYHPSLSVVHRLASQSTGRYEWKHCETPLSGWMDSRSQTPHEITIMRS